MKNKYSKTFLWHLIEKCKPIWRIKWRDLNSLLCWGKHKEKYNFEARVLNPVLQDLKTLQFNLIFSKEKQEYVFELQKQNIFPETMTLRAPRKIMIYNLKRKIATQKVEYSKGKNKAIKGNDK